MGVQTNAEVAATQLEKVIDKVEVLFERNDDFLKEIQKAGDVEEVSTKLLRIPLEVNPGGNAGSFDPDGGNYGRGSGEQYDQATVGPVYKKMVYEMTFLSKYATDSREKAIIDSTNRIVDEGQKAFRAYLDKVLNGGAGNGVLGTISAVNGNTLTMAVPSGAQLVYNNQPVQVVDSTLTILRGTCKVLMADPIIAQTITVDALPAGVVATDVILSDGVAVPNPVDLYGVKYHQSAATTGTWLNLNRANYPVQLRTPRVNGNNGALVPMQPRLALNLVRKSLGLAMLGSPFAYMAVEQSHAWDQLATTVQIIDRSSRETGEGQDMSIRGAKGGAGKMCGLRIKEGQNADQTRIDFIDSSVWGRAVIKPMGFTKFANGLTWYQVYGADGGPAAAMGFAYEYDFQVFTKNPRKGSFIDTLLRPQGY